MNTKSNCIDCGLKDDYDLEDDYEPCEQPRAIVFSLGDTVHQVTTSEEFPDGTPATGQIMGLRCEPGGTAASHAQLFFQGFSGRARYQWICIEDLFHSEQDAEAVSLARREYFASCSPSNVDGFAILAAAAPDAVAPIKKK